MNKEVTINLDTLTDVQLAELQRVFLLNGPYPPQYYQIEGELERRVREKVKKLRDKLSNNT